MAEFRITDPVKVPQEFWDLRGKAFFGFDHAKIAVGQGIQLTHLTPPEQMRYLLFRVDQDVNRAQPAKAAKEQPGRMGRITQREIS